MRRVLILYMLWLAFGLSTASATEQERNGRALVDGAERAMALASNGLADEFTFTMRIQRGEQDLRSRWKASRLIGLPNFWGEVRLLDSDEPGAMEVLVFEDKVLSAQIDLARPANSGLSVAEGPSLARRQAANVHGALYGGPLHGGLEAGDQGAMSVFDLARRMGPPKGVRSDPGEPDVVVVEYTSPARSLTLRLAAGANGGLRGYDFRQTSPGKEYRGFRATLDKVVVGTVGTTPVITQARYSEEVAPADSAQPAYSRVIEFDRPAQNIQLNLSPQESDFRFRNPPPAGIKVFNLDGGRTGLEYAWTGDSIVRGTPEEFGKVDAVIDDRLAARANEPKQRFGWFWWIIGAGGALSIAVAIWWRRR